MKKLLLSYFLASLLFSCLSLRISYALAPTSAFQEKKHVTFENPEKRNLYEVLNVAGILPENTTETPDNNFYHALINRFIDASALLADREAQKKQWSNFQSFSEAVLALDRNLEGRAFMRIYPIQDDKDQFSIGINIIDRSGNILHLELKPVILDARPIGNDIAYSNKRTSVLVPLSNLNPELEWIHSPQTSIMDLPFPNAYIKNAEKEVEKFLKNVASDLGTMFAKRVTFGEILKKYPMALPVFKKMFPDQTIEKDAIIDIPQPHDGIVLINQILQAEFVARFLNSTEGIADFSGWVSSSKIRKERIEIQRGPLTVESLLNEFFIAISDYTSPDRDIRDIRFKHSPVKVFGQWLNAGAKPGELRFEIAPPGEVGYSISDGALVFDVDKTLLAKGTNFSDDINDVPVRSAFMRILKIGVPIRIISGNASVEQYFRILKFLEEIAESTDNNLPATEQALSSDHLQKLEMYTSTGSVRIVYNTTSGMFEKDDSYDVSEVLDESENLETSFRNLAEKLRPRLIEWLKTHLGSPGDEYGLTNLKEQARKMDKAAGEKIIKKITALEKAMAVAAQKNEEPEDYLFPIIESNFESKTKAQTDMPFFIDFRDGVSATIKGEGFRETRTQDGQKLLRDAFMEKITALKRTDPLTAKFNFGKGGSTSIDITFGSLTKASAAIHLLDELQRTCPDADITAENIVYFGDEFYDDGLSKGNDLYLKDPRILGITLVHVGDNTLEQTPYTIAFQAPGEGGTHGTLEHMLREQEILYVLDSMDGARAGTTLAEHPLERSYTIGAFYRGYPLFSVTYFPKMEELEDMNPLIISDLSSVQLSTDTVKAQNSPSAYIPESTRDSGKAQDMVRELRQIFSNDEDEQTRRSGSWFIRKLIDPTSNLVLVRQGHPPKSKLVILAHAFLRGAQVIYLPGKEDAAVGDLFPLNESEYLDGESRFPTVYAFFPWNPAHVIGFKPDEFRHALKRSGGEQIFLPVPLSHELEDRKTTTESEGQAA